MNRKVLYEKRGILLEANLFFLPLLNIAPLSIEKKKVQKKLTSFVSL